jgi:hypothetical protein
LDPDASFRVGEIDPGLVRVVAEDRGTVDGGLTASGLRSRGAEAPRRVPPKRLI